MRSRKLVSYRRPWLILTLAIAVGIVVVTGSDFVHTAETESWATAVFRILVAGSTLLFWLSGRRSGPIWLQAWGGAILSGMIWSTILILAWRVWGSRHYDAS